MRRMITETDVEKLDSIKPSEIQKLGKITDADIASVQAMQSPIGATANYVLTADGAGKATYKQSQSGARITFPNGGPSEVYKSWFKQYPGSSYDRADFPGFTIVKLTDCNHLLSLGFNKFPHYKKDDGTKVYVNPGDYFIMQGYYDDVIFGVKTEIYNQFLTDTANDKYAKFYTGVIGYHKYEQSE